MLSVIAAGRGVSVLTIWQAEVAEVAGTPRGTGRRSSCRPSRQLAARRLIGWGVT